MEKITSEETVQIGPRISKSLKRDIDIICAKEGIDSKDLISQVLFEYVKKYNDGNTA